MVHTASELHNEHIQSHQQSHISGAHLAVDVLQLENPDLSCSECYPPRRVSPSSPFGRFWNWYSSNYAAISYTSKTQENFNILLGQPTSLGLRLCIRDIIFSCRYHPELPDPRDTALALIQRYTARLRLPTLPFNYQNIFDIHIDQSQSFGFEEPGNFSQYFGELESPIVAPPGHHHSITVFDSTPLSTHPEDSLLPYSEEVTTSEPSTSAYTPSIPPPYRYLDNHVFDVEDYTTASLGVTEFSDNTSSSYYSQLEFPQLDLSQQDVLPPVEEPLENIEDLEPSEPSELLDDNTNSHYTPSNSLPPILIMNQQQQQQQNQPQPQPQPQQPQQQQAPGPNQALAQAATAMTALAAALGQGSEKTLLPVSSFLGDGSQEGTNW